MKTCAVVPAAGLGKRLGAGVDKAFVRLLDRPLVAWTLGALEGSPDIEEIIPVFDRADMEAGLKLLEDFGIKKAKKIAEGGRERQDSVYNALRLISDKNSIVLIHDGARPLITGALIRDIIRGLDGYDGALAALPPKDTVKETDGKDVVLRTLNRRLLCAVQTPQAFRCGTIVSAYERAMKDGYYSTDDSALVEKYGGRVRAVLGSETNIKITTPEDILIAEVFLGATRAVR